MQETDKTELVEKLLMDFVELYNVSKADVNAPETADKMMAFRVDYHALVDNDIDILSILDRELGGDSQLYILVLSALFFVEKDGRMLDKAQELLYLDQLPIDMCLRILEQISMNRFSCGLPVPEYGSSRELHRHLLRRMERECPVNCKYIPYEERNHNLIILETDTLLSDDHAPTRIVLEIYKMLKHQLGYEVYLLVDFLRMDTDNMENYWAFPYRARYLPQQDGEFVREYQGVEVYGYQQVVWEHPLDSVRDSMERIYKRKPEFVWHIGGESVLSDMIANVCPLVSTGCTDGYAVSEAPVLVSYMQVDRERNKSIERYCIPRSQNLLPIDFVITMDVVEDFIQGEKRYCHEDIGLPEDGFVIAVVGNRLDMEVTEAFISVMEEIAHREANVYFLVIGNTKLRRWNRGILQDRVVHLGFQKDLPGVLSATELFLNPPRQGGGGSALFSACVGVPVVTLPDCDVANLGDAFVCDSLEHFPGLVSRYCHDREYYQAQVAYAHQVYKRMKSIDNCAAVKSTVERIKVLFCESALRCREEDDT